MSTEQASLSSGSSSTARSSAPFGLAAERSPHAISGDEVCKRLEVALAVGLTAEEAAVRRARYGVNALPRPPRPSAWRRWLRQFGNPLVGALLVAALVAVFVALLESNPAHLGWLVRFGDALAIGIIVVLNALLGFVQESRADQALEALERLAAPTARVRRDGSLVSLPARELVPGDVIQLDTGDAVPADLRLIETHGLAVSEAALTGESLPVEKTASAVLDPEALPADRRNMAFMATLIARGQGLGVVVGTGATTELGRIGALLSQEHQESTPLEQRIAHLGKLILAACVAISVALFVVGLWHGSQTWPALLLTAVSLAVAAIPEGLPAITTITLALGMQRMANRGALVRRLAAVETLGSATVICTDKTGTLTENRMRVTDLMTLEERCEFSLPRDGAAVSPSPQSERLGVPCIVPGRAPYEVVVTAVCCNTASVTGDSATGDPLEVALLELAQEVGVARADVMEGVSAQEVVPFDSATQSMTVVLRDESGDGVAHVKGAPESVVARCSQVLGPAGKVELGRDERRQVLDAASQYAGRGLRVLALARASVDAGQPPSQLSDLCLLGLVAMRDPPRPGVGRSIARCHSAGIAVAMITGDHPRTALAIAQEVGIATQDGPLMTGAELRELDEAQLSSRVEAVRVFARVVPEQKLRIVRALRERGHIVAMTGDGVNDAPALQRAQIGVAMGRGGTDVARQASEMVLADDDFSSIVEAVAEGRTIFANIRKFVFFLNSSNAGLVVAVLVSAVLGLRAQLPPLQLLWINLVTNGLPALALGADTAEPDVMSRPPRSPERGIFELRDAFGVAWVGLVMGLSGLLLLGQPELFGGGGGGLLTTADPAVARTMAFAMLGLSPLFHVFNTRRPERSLFTPGQPTNRLLWGAVVVSGLCQVASLVAPPLQPLFHTTPLNGQQWLVVLALSALPLPAVELARLLERAFARRAPS